jgi:3',5'-cyclic AMP phosphodiesterase CpdA
VQVDYERSVWGAIGWRRVVAQLELKLAKRAKRYADAPEALRRLLRRAQQGGFDHVVLSGDLTALAVDEEFEGVRDALGELADRPDRLTVIPGNHDVFTPGSQKKRRFERWFGHLLHSDLPEFQVEGPWPMVRLLGESAAIIGLNSARVPFFPGIAAGKVGDDQLAALVRICAHPSLRGRTIYVTVHHAPVRKDGKFDRRDHGLLDADRLVEACRIGGVTAVLCGHIHAKYNFAITGGPTVVCGGSSTWKDREGYLLLESQPGGLHIEQQRLEPANVVEVEPAVQPAPATPIIVTG